MAEIILIIIKRAASGTDDPKFGEEAPNAGSGKA
jgi:hypothetical protein